MLETLLGVGDGGQLRCPKSKKKKSEEERRIRKRRRRK